MKLAYLASRYPAISHTFIMREVFALREAGIDVRTLTIRRVPDAQLLTDLDRQEAARTKSILPAGPWRILSAHATVFSHSPARYVRALGNALWRRPPGLRHLIWQLFYFVEAGVLAASLRREGITHVHAHFANVAANVAQLAAKMNGGTWSLTLHGHADYGDPTTSRLADKIEAAAFTVCVSDYGKAQAMLHTHPALWPKINRVYCGIDPRHFQPAPRDHHHAAAPPLHLLTVARLSPEKGLNILLDAIAQARGEGVQLTLTLVGEGSMRAVLEDQTRRLRLGDHVVFAGAIGQNRIREFYQNADAFVLPSFSEGLPVVLMEAMAMGLPVIASRITGIPELVREGVDGWLVPPGNAVELAGAFRSLAVLPDQRRQFGASARERICTHFDARVTQSPLMELFRTHLAASASENPVEPNRHAKIETSARSEAY